MRAMAFSTARRPLVALACLLACSPQPSGAGADAQAKSDPGSGAGAQDETAAKPKPFGRIAEDAPVPIASLVGKDLATVEQLLGTPENVSSSRISCVRFVPKRVFFSCEQELRWYSAKSDKVDLVAVDFEDGKAASVALTGLVGEGEFTPESALSVVGMFLPGEPRSHQPEPNVTVWDYWNSEARLKIDGKQYRVQISVIDGEWPRSKVEVAVNHPLTNDEKSRIKQTD